MFFKDRLYWFFRNLTAFIVCILLSPVFFGWLIIYTYFGIIRFLFITDGSEVLGWPNDWNWTP